jgi:hypothetical protein
MTTQDENTTMYEHQSFDQFPKAPMFPAGWDLSEMQQSVSKDVEVNASEEEDQNINL